jgi:hypothetical protein
MKTHEKLFVILCLSLAAFAAWKALSESINEARAARWAERVAARTLSNGEGSVSIKYGYTFTAVFDEDEVMNEATVSYGSKTVSKRDFNKSKIAGAIIGSKAKEFANGFVTGLRSESKHKPSGGRDE